MAVIMISEVPGADRGLVEGLRASGLPEALPAFPGFISHVSGPTDTGFRVVEVWDRKTAHQAWSTPTRPDPSARPVATPPEYIDLAITLPEPHVDPHSHRPPRRP